jgi:hypothetical protein
MKGKQGLIINDWWSLIHLGFQKNKHKLIALEEKLFGEIIEI